MGGGGDSGEPFKTEGKVLNNPGWLAVYGKEAQDDDANLTPVKDKEKAQTLEVTLKATETRPPARYSEATLLTAMEGAGKTVEDEELRAAMAGRGLGTPATRAQIIENLISEAYVHREGRDLQPTAKAFSLMTLLNGLGVTELTQPELTGDWEWKLARMERGEMSRGDFMKEIAKMTRHLVDSAKALEHYQAFQKLQAKPDVKVAGWIALLERDAKRREAAQNAPAPVPEAPPPTEKAAATEKQSGSGPARTSGAPVPPKAAKGSAK